MAKKKLPAGFMKLAKAPAGAMPTLPGKQAMPMKLPPKKKGGK